MRRHSPTRSGHSVLGLLSVLALLALACFVPMAQAENYDSSGIEYRDAPPTATGQIPTKEVPANISKKNGEAQNPGSSNNTGGSEKDSSGEEAGSGGVTGTNGGGTGQGDPGTQQGNSGKLSPAGKIAVAKSLGNGSADESSDSGSSPLVPILIAIAAVIAVAIAVVVIRQRRQRDSPDGHVSPEAS
jgi:cobalamin biosynthesis Mg chelatase CobN